MAVGQLGLFDDPGKPEKSPTPLPNIPSNRKKLDALDDRIVELHKEDSTVCDEPMRLTLKIWQQEGLEDLLQSGNMEKFFVWFLFIASHPDTVARRRRELTSDKHGPPICQMSPGAKEKLQSRQDAWKKEYYSKYSDISQSPEERLEKMIDYLIKRVGYDIHTVPPFFEVEKNLL